jgi:hypothetical protein
MEGAQTNLSELAAALVEFQADVPTISKNRTAKIKTRTGADYSYNYADLGDIWDAVRAPLNKNGLAVTQSLTGGSDGWTGIKTTIWHKSGQHYAETVDVPTQDKTAQETGSQITYYKRYALAAALGISTEEDDDGQAGNDKPTAPLRTTSTDTASAKQMNYLESLMRQAKFTPEQIEAGKAKVHTKAEVSEAIEKMQQKILDMEEQAL